MADHVPLVETPSSEVAENIQEKQDTAEPTESIPKKTEDADKCSCSNCCRWCCKILVIVLCLPFLIIISLLGLILTIVIFPCKCCSPCCAPCWQGLVDTIVYILKAPFNLVLWATDKVTDDDEEKQTLIKKGSDVEQG